MGLLPPVPVLASKLTSMLLWSVLSSFQGDKNLPVVTTEVCLCSSDLQVLLLLQILCPALLFLWLLLQIPAASVPEVSVQRVHWLHHRSEWEEWLQHGGGLPEDTLHQAGKFLWFPCLLWFLWFLFRVCFWLCVSQINRYQYLLKTKE